MFTSLLLIFGLCSYLTSAHYGCGTDRIQHRKIHQNLNVKPIKNNNHKHKPRKNLEGRAQDPDGSNIFDNIRIHYDTSQLEEDWATYSKKDYFVNDVIPAAKEWLQKAILVRPVDGPLSFSVPCDKDGTTWTSGQNAGECKEMNRGWNKCGDTGATIPTFMYDEMAICPTQYALSCSTSSYPQGPGMADTDLVIYFTGDASRDFTRSCESVMGFAAYCQTNSRNRPIAGYINLCKSTIDATEVLTWEEVISLIVHETFHVLGFSSDGFDNFVNSNDQKRQETDGDVYETVLKRGKKRAIITLPTVVEKAREFFDCDTMEGVELEDYGITPEGSPSSHWDNRIVMYDFMISYVPPAAPYSTLTLAVLADSGWYQIDWKYAQEPSYGRHGGCDWSDSKCIVNGRSIDDNAFCTQSVKYSCSSSHIGKFYCGLSVWNAELPSNQQYFSDPTQGGDNVYPDFCPLFEEYSNGDCRLWGPNNQGTSDDNTADLGGFISGNSKCALIEGETNGIGAGCYPTECIRNATGSYVGSRLTIYRNYKLTAFDVITCWAEESGVAKEFPYDYNTEENYGFTMIYCPEFESICYDESPWICNGHGTIVDGACVCSAGYFGVDCTIENNEENRNLYGDTDSLSKYTEEVCHGGVWPYTLDNPNVGILNIEIDNINQAGYDTLLYRDAIRNWMAILTDISQCDVELVNYRENGTQIVTDIVYYSSSKTWSDVNTRDALDVFYRLFHNDGSLVIEQIQISDGEHEDNLDGVNMIRIWSIYVIIISSIILLI